MQKKNQHQLIINQETLALINKASQSQLAQWYDIVNNFISKDFYTKIREKLFSNIISKTEIIYDINGIEKILIISPPQITESTITAKEINWEKVLKFAENGKKKIRCYKTIHKELSVKEAKDTELGYTIDFGWIEGEDWFQNHIQDFVESKEQKISKKSPGTIRIKENI